LRLSFVKVLDNPSLDCLRAFSGLILKFPSLKPLCALACAFLIDFGKERPSRIGNTVSGATSRKRQKVAAKVVLIYNSSPNHYHSIFLCKKKEIFEKFNKNF